MVDLKVKIITDISKLKADVKKAFDQNFSLGGAKDSGGKGGGGFFAGIGKSLVNIAAGILTAITAMKPVQDMVKLGLSIIAFYLVKFVKWMAEVIPEALNYLAGLPGKIWEWIKQGWDWVVNKLIELKDKFVEWLSALPGKIWELLKEGWNWVVNKLIELKDKFVEWLSNLPERIREKLRELWDYLGEKWENFKELMREKLELLKEKLKEWIDKAKDWFKELPIKIKEKLTELWNTLKETWQRFTDKLQSIWDSIKALPQRIWDFMKNLGSIIASAIKSFFGGKSTSVDDAIIKPDGSIIKTHPNDTIIATQNPGGLGGGKVFNFYGVTPQEMVDVIRRELADDIRYSTRF